MKVVLSTDLRFGFLYFPLIVKRTFHSPYVLKENLSLIPQKHEVNKCTYTDLVDDMQFSWLFLHFRGICRLWYVLKVSLIFLFLYPLLAVSATAVTNVAKLSRVFENLSVSNPLKDCGEPVRGLCTHFRRLRLKAVLLYYYRSISFIHQKNFGLLQLFHICAFAVRV